MKTTIATIVLCIASGLSARAQENQRFEQISEAYVQARESAIEQATKPIDEKYLNDLKALLETLTTSGRLEEATEVKATIEKRMMKLSLPDEWIWAGDQKKILTLHGDGTATHSSWDERGAWILLDENRIRLLASHTSFLISIEEGGDSGEVIARNGAKTTIRRQR